MAALRLESHMDPWWSLIAPEARPGPVIACRLDNVTPMLLLAGHSDGAASPDGVLQTALLASRRLQSLCSAP